MAPWWKCWMMLLLLSSTQMLCLETSHSDLSNKEDDRDATGALHNGNKIGVTEVDFHDEALEEQGYYLHRLFLQYGENDTLSYRGLHKLLCSLGLGEISVLQISQKGSQSSTPALDGDGPQATGLQDEEDEKEFNRLPLVARPVFPPDHPAKGHLHGNCLNVTQLLWNFGLGTASHITPSHFTFLCPALLYQIDSGVCLRHPGDVLLAVRRGATFLSALGWGSLALTVISLPSLMALSVVPLLPQPKLHTVLCPMMGLAVGTLCGDALLHLLPHTNPSLHSGPGQWDAVLKGLCVLGGLYLLFLIEGIMGLKRHHKAKKKKLPSEDIIADRDITPLRGVAIGEPSEPVGNVHGHSHDPPALGMAGLGSLVWMVVMGDGIHNLTDGLAIGTAFSQSLTGGVSTSVAVFCHELPHELGDLAVLLAAGWPVRRLLLFSLVSALLSFLGLLGGISLGQHSTQLSSWVLALTAGVFLYVSLSDLVPEMLRGDPGPLMPVTRFLLQNLGLLTGATIMLCIALFEEDIAFNLGDS